MLVVYIKKVEKELLEVGLGQELLASDVEVTRTAAEDARGLLIFLNGLVLCPFLVLF